MIARLLAKALLLITQSVILAAMLSREKIIVGVALVVLVGGLGVAIQRFRTNDAALLAVDDSAIRATTTVTINSQTYEVEVAATAEEQTLGLSHRSSLAKQRGMLFPFDVPSRPFFWMKDMKFPIDIVWIRDDQIVDISSNLSVPSLETAPDDLPTYQPKTDAEYALELNAGEAANMKIGDTVRITHHDAS